MTTSLIDGPLAPPEQRHAALLRRLHETVHVGSDRSWRVPDRVNGLVTRGGKVREKVSYSAARLAVSSNRYAMLPQPQPGDRVHTNVAPSMHLYWAELLPSKD